MDLEQVRMAEFPSEFLGYVNKEECSALLSHVVSETSDKFMVRVTRMDTSILEGNVRFTFCLEVLGGVHDGQLMEETFPIRTDQDLKLWLQQMACLGCKVWQWGSGRKINFLDAWEEVAPKLVGTIQVGFRVPDGVVLFLPQDALYSATCSECGKESPACWRASELKRWLHRFRWIAFNEGQKILHYCRQCTKRMLNL